MNLNNIGFNGGDTIAQRNTAMRQTAGVKNKPYLTGELLQVINNFTLVIAEKADLSAIAECQIFKLSADFFQVRLP